MLCKNEFTICSLNIVPVQCHCSPSGYHECEHDGGNAVLQIYSGAWPPVEIRTKTDLKRDNSLPAVIYLKS